MFHKGQNLVGRFCFNHGLVFQLLFKEIGHIKFIAAAVSWQRNEGERGKILEGMNVLYNRQRLSACNQDILKLIDGLIVVFLPNLERSGNDRHFHLSALKGFKGIGRLAVADLEMDAGIGLVE